MVQAVEKEKRRRGAFGYSKQQPREKEKKKISPINSQPKCRNSQRISRELDWKGGGGCNGGA